MNKFTCTSHWYPNISMEFFALLYLQAHLMGWVEYKALRDFWSFIKFSVPFGKWASQIQEENLEFYQASLGTPSKLLERMVYNCNYNTTYSTVYTYCPTEATWPSEGKPRFPVQKNTSVLSFSFIQTTDWQVSMPCGTKFLQLLQFFGWSATISSCKK